MIAKLVFPIWTSFLKQIIFHFLWKSCCEVQNQLPRITVNILCIESNVNRIPHYTRKHYYYWHVHKLTHMYILNIRVEYCLLF